MKNKPEKHGLVPKLRFPEFWEAGKWEIIPLSQLAKRSTQKNSGGVLSRVLTNSAEFGVVDQRDYFEKDIANQGNLDGYYVVKKGDYVYNPRISATAPVGPISKNNIATGVMSPLYTVFRFNSENSDLYAYYFKTAGWHQYMRQASSTGARHDRMAITNADFMAMPLPVTSPNEQQKIADCLASLDELITLEAQKLDTLKAHKKGLMQQLFPAEGETLPQLRFPEFRDAGDWDVTSLDRYFDRIRNGFVGTATPYYVADGIPYLQGKNIKQGQIDPTGLVFISSDFHKTQKKSQLNATDILMVQSGHVGECAVVGENFAGSNCHALVVLSPCGKVDSRFFAHYFYSPQGQARISIITTGNTIKHILASDLRVLEITAPVFHEQQKIADCLTTLDDLITAQTQKLAALKVHKQGLMQQLFPALDEVTV